MCIRDSVYTIRYLYMCLSHSEQIRYAESFSSKKNTLKWIRTDRQRHLLERKQPTGHQEKQSEWRKLLFAATATCQCLYITRRHQPRHRPGTTNVRRSQRNGIWAVSYTHLLFSFRTWTLAPMPSLLTYNWHAFGVCQDLIGGEALASYQSLYLMPV